MLPHANINDYVEKNERTLSLKFENSEDDEDQPLDFSTGSNFRNTQESLISEDWRYKSPLYESLLSRVVTKSPDRQRSHDKSPRLLVAPKSPKKGWPNKSPSPESGVSTGSLSPDGSSPVHISPSYFPSFPSFSSRNYSERSSYLDAQARDDKKVNYNHREIPSALSLGLPMAAPSLAQPVDYLSKLSMNHVISYAELTNNIAIMARLRNLGGASLSESNNPLFGQNLLPVTQDQSDNSCTRNLMEKFHIPSSEMPKINASHFDRVYSLEQMQKITQENLKKFQREVMLKKRDDNPSKSRRAAARSAPYSNGRTDLRASDESGQDANGDSQGESVDMEVDARTRQYQEKRRKNNEAAKKSRDQRKLKEEETAIRAAFLEQENGIITQVMIDQFLTIEMLNRRIASLAALQR